eukprot:gb/GECH01011798.1/.p1 GENE.gb/GECH01011798.1/~~gb/GECH01011798.1/.p1  ORF type:complete len:215 (+),score=63.50 gb/GECH01011798.1/:1-645(+)
MSQPELIYFAIRGRGEPIRLLFEDNNIDYKDTPMKTWQDDKQRFIDEGIAPFGQIPVVKVDGKHLSQSNAILRFFGRKYNLYGKDDDEHYRVDFLMDGIEDWRVPYLRLIYRSENYEEDKKSYVTGAQKKFLGIYESLLKQNADGAKYFVGDDITIADYLIFEMIDLALRLDSNALQDFPLLASYHKRFSERSNIAKYLASGRRPERPNGNQNG